jgi:hypothetical protein
VELLISRDGIRNKEPEKLRCCTDVMSQNSRSTEGVAFPDATSSAELAITAISSAATTYTTPAVYATGPAISVNGAEAVPTETQNSTATATLSSTPVEYTGAATQMSLASIASYLGGGIFAIVAFV